MELWIRSQDREMLKQASVLYVADDGEEGFSIKHYGVRFGIYKTKERALEVLDEIQNVIRSKYATSFDYEKALSSFKKEDANYMLKQMAVYEMPEE